MSFHHFPYRLTRNQRRIYLTLVAEAKAAESAGAEVSATMMTITEIAARLGVKNVENMRRSLEQLQFKLPLVPSRKFRFRCQETGGTTGGKVQIWWAERKKKRNTEQPEATE